MCLCVRVCVCVCVYVCMCVQWPSHVWLFGILWTVACHTSLSLTISQSLTKFMSIESVMTSTHLMLSHTCLLLPSIFPNIRVFSRVSTILISISPMTLQGWFPLEVTCLISLLPKRLWGDFLALCLEGINYLALSLLYHQNFTSLNDYWKHYSLDYTDLCQQSNVFVL